MILSPLVSHATHPSILSLGAVGVPCFIVARRTAANVPLQTNRGSLLAASRRTNGQKN